MIIKINKPRFRSKILFLDYDWSIVCPKDNKTFPRDIQDWQWLNSSIPDIIKKYYKNGYAICIVTNQTKEWKKQQIINVIESLEIPAFIAIAFEKNNYKPSLYLYNELFDEEQRKKINLDKSVLCGDALGRKNDHSDSDLKFAQAIGIKSIAPEDLFNIKIKKDKDRVKTSQSQEIVIMVGYPGSGKSHLISQVFEPNTNYFIAHSDDLKTSAKMIKTAKKYVLEGKSIVFDATNPSKEKRAEYIEFAKLHKIPIRCIYVTTTMVESMARNNKRDKPVPRIVYNVYNKKFIEPSRDEGFDVIKV
jgi:bifunctional polynucleotide phosphatase/kinase